MNPKDVTDIIKAFYEENPFPNYDDIDSAESLREKAQKGIFAHLLDEQISTNAKILEVGCGTGQLSNYLGMTWGRTVIGTDICHNSLQLANKFKEKHGIGNVSFVEMNLFKPVFQLASFDIVICNGVLHHTGQPFLGFQTLSRLVKKNGYIIIGLYNKYGRIFTDVRRTIFKLTGNRFVDIDPYLKSASIDEKRRRIWFLDQYCNPHESKHTIGEVLRWFDKCGIEFVNGIPKVTSLDTFSAKEELFKNNSIGTSLDHFIVQFGMIFTSGRDGGLFIMIGRKKGDGYA